MSRRIWRVGTLTYTLGGIVALFGWLLAGDFVWAMKERAVGNVAALLLRTLETSDFLYSILIVSIPNFTNIFLMPIVSYRSDRHRGRYGRRIPYIMATTPFVVAGLLGLGFTPFLGRQLQQWIGPETISYQSAGLIVFTVFWLSLDFGTTLTNAIFTALINDVVPQALLGRFFALFRAMSLGAGIIFNYCLLGKAEHYSMLIFCGLGILYGTGLTLLCFKVKEGEYPPPENDSTVPAGFRAAVRVYFRECFSHPYYRWVSTGLTLCSVAIMPVNIFTVYYAKSVGMSMDELGEYLALTYVISFILSYLMGILADRFHPLRTGIVSMILYALVMLTGGLLVAGKCSFAVALVAHGVVSGAFFTLTASYGQRLFPKARFAQFNSAVCGMIAIGGMFAAPVIGKALDFLGNDYRYTFFFAFGLTFCGVLAMLKVLRGYNRFGGDAAYVPPEP